MGNRLRSSEKKSSASWKRLLRGGRAYVCARGSVREQGDDRYSVVNTGASAAVLKEEVDTLECALASSLIRCTLVNVDSTGNDRGGEVQGKHSTTVVRDTGGLLHPCRLHLAWR